jgi:hypothetical protein
MAIGQPRKKCETLSEKQVKSIPQVTEHFLSKWEAPSLIISPAKKKHMCVYVCVYIYIYIYIYIYVYIYIYI